ncbi:M48 family metallopeptidase [Orrella sp. NBD-18]|uniref:M48 family metallopeptidase n=1 Tax=Sheuella amnicola TaxID=2707330 RepID=A0A6B2R3L2_9BURK|nr:M48 family metallopeptidase [Sheuella amnicola]NDY83647.1 M48 family metallopeptidase [Sheuella amnicola]
MLTILFVVFLLSSLMVRLWLAYRQTNHVFWNRTQVPVEFEEKIGLASHQRAANYTIAKVRLAVFETIFDAAVLAGLTLMGGLQLLDTWVGSLTSNDLLRQMLLIVSVVLVLGILGMPFSIYRQFVLEAKFGFNRMTPGLFVMDTIKGLILGALLGLPLMAAVLWLMAEAGAYWWLWAWGLLSLFSLLIQYIYPTWISPLFNKFKPLEDEDLAQSIQALANRCDFTLSGLLVMDGSKRSAHGNAYFTGFGRNRRIVFFDTLLSRLTKDEIIAVLAHELGHFKHHHVTKRLIMSFTGSLIFFAILGWLAQQVWFYTDLGVEPRLGSRNDAMALLLFFMVMPVFTFALTPFFSWMSRKDEFEADRFAAKQSSADDLVSALVKLYNDNASTLTPDPVHSAFYDSHPPASIRIRHLKRAV